MANNQSNTDKLKAEKAKADKLAAEKVLEDKKIADAIALEEKEKLDKIEADKLAAEKVLEEEAEKLKARKGTTKYFFKSKKNIGFKKRNFYLPSTNKRYLIIAGAEIDEKTYNLFGEHAQKAFFED